MKTEKKLLYIKIAAPKTPKRRSRAGETFVPRSISHSASSSSVPVLVMPEWISITNKGLFRRRLQAAIFGECLLHV